MHSYAKPPPAETIGASPTLLESGSIYHKEDKNNNISDTKCHTNSDKTVDTFDPLTLWDSSPDSRAAAMALSDMARNHTLLREERKQGSSSAPTTPVKKRHKSSSSTKGSAGVCKRPMNAFMLFAKRFRVEYTQLHPGKDNR